MGLAQGFFAPLEAHPSLLQARYALETAQAQVRGLQSPVSLSAQGGLLFFQNQPPASGPACAQNPAACVALPDNGRNLQVGITLTPFAFGDVADGIAQAQIGVEQAALGLRQARTQLEAQAVETALRVGLSQAALETAEVGNRLALLSLESARLREGRGAASPSEARQAEATLRQANLQLADARQNLELSQASLRDLIGQTAATPPALRLPGSQTTPAVRQAELQVLQARLGLSRAQREATPVAQASYTRNTSPNDSLSASINSRTLQPSLSYSNTSQARTEPQSRIEGTFQIGLSVAFNPGVFDALEAAQKQIAAAEQGLENARRSSRLQEDLLRSSALSAERSLALSRQALTDAQKTLEEAKERERLGLASPLATAQADLGLAQAQLALRSAELSYAQRVLDMYRFFGLPVSETGGR